MSGFQDRHVVEFLLPADGSGGAGLVGGGSIELSPEAVVLSGTRRGLFGMTREARDEIRAERIVDVRRSGRRVAFGVIDGPGATAISRVVMLNASSKDAAASIVAGLPQMRQQDVIAVPADDADFPARLTGATPWATVAPTLIALNVAVFVAMAAAGINVLQPRGQDLLPWGANFAPLTTDGQWWRLLTSTFLHFGLAHLALNMWALFSVGSLVERVYGNAFFVLLYVFTPAARRASPGGRTWSARAPRARCSASTARSSRTSSCRRRRSRRRCSQIC